MDNNKNGSNESNESHIDYKVECELWRERCRVMRENIKTIETIVGNVYKEHAPAAKLTLEKEVLVAELTSAVTRINTLQELYDSLSETHSALCDDANIILVNIERLQRNEVLDRNIRIAAARLLDAMDREECINTIYRSNEVKQADKHLRAVLFVPRGTVWNGEKGSAGDR